MNKSRITSFCGYAAIVLFSLGWGDALIGGFTLPHHPPFSGEIAAACVLFSVPCTLLWILGTIIHRIRVSGAQIQAAALVEAGQRLQTAGQVARPVAPGPPANLQRTAGK